MAMWHLRKEGSAFFAICLLAFAGGACGTWVGNPKRPSDQTGTSTVSLAVQGVDNATALLGNSISVSDEKGHVIGTLNLNQARLVLQGIKFKPYETTLPFGGSSTSASNAGVTSGSGTTETQFQGPYVVDLLTNEMTPPANTITVPGVSYQDIELTLHKVAAAEVQGLSSSDPLVNHSLYLEGTYTPTGQSARAFTISYDINDQFTLAGARSNSHGVAIQPGQVNHLIIAFRLYQWFSFANAHTNGKGVSLASLPDGPISLDDNAQGIAQEVRKVITENIKESGAFGRDQNGDGQLSKNETDDSE